MYAKKNFTVNSGLFLLFLVSGFALLYLSMKYFPGRNAAVYGAYAVFAVLVFSFNRLVLKNVMKKCVRCCEKISHETEADDIVYDTSDPVLPVIEKIQELKNREKQAASLARELRKKNELVFREISLFFDNIKAKDNFFDGMGKFRNDINSISFEVDEFKKGLRLFEDYMTKAAEEQITSVSNLYDVIKSLMESIEKESKIALKAEAISREMLDTVKSGGEDITRTIAYITEIEKLSSKINEIIAVIDNITEQTNLLAMNAAIEAAHAGDAGKGFSVVAGEIQKLSRETNQSSRKISDLVKNVSETVKSVTANAQNASSGLRAIMDSVTKTESIVADITGSINEQAEDGSRILNAAGTLFSAAEAIKKNTDKNIEIFSSLSKLQERVKSLGAVIETEVEVLKESFKSKDVAINSIMGGKVSAVQKAPAQLQADDGPEFLIAEEELLEPSC